MDADGFIYVTGFFMGPTAEFDGITLQNPNWNPPWDPNGYIGKLDPDGNWLWVDIFDGIKDAEGSRDNRLAIDQSSNIYVVGSFENTAKYGPFTITSNGEWDAFIFKMDTDGNWLWAEGFGSNKTDRANSIAVDVCDDVYITGEYRNPMVFPGANASNGSDTLSHKKKRDIFVAKMNNQGDWKWAKRARGPGTDKPYQMFVDANKQVFLGGTTKDTLVFNNSLSVAPQIADDTTASSWVAQLDGSTNSGNWVWAKLAGSDTSDDDRTGDICTDAFGNVYAVGFYEDAASFDGLVLNSLGRKDIFVWKMSMTTMPPFTYNITYDTIIVSDSIVSNPLDTGLLLLSSSFAIDGCDTTFIDSVIHLTNSNTHSIISQSIGTLDIYPNPTNGILNIEFSILNHQDIRLNLLNTIGEVIFTEDIKQFIGKHIKQINLADNAKGIYFLEIATDYGVINKKLILQ